MTILYMKKIRIFNEVLNAFIQNKFIEKKL